MTNKKFATLISDYLIRHSFAYYNKDCGNCAKAIREAVETVLDVKVERTLSAKDYGSSYEKVGFEKVFEFPKQDKSEYKPEIGDLAIIQYEPHGHICIYCFGFNPDTGRPYIGWVSDFKQRDMYGGKIREKNPQFNIFRLKNAS